MTREEILALSAGRDLDVLIHRKVMGRDCKHFTPEPGEFGSDLNGWYDWPQMKVLPRLVPCYSMDIAAAWEVVKHLATRGIELTLEDWRSLPEGGGWKAMFDLPDGHDTGDALGQDAPLAICRAALLAVPLVAVEGVR